MKVKVQDGKITVGRHDVADYIRELDDGYYNFSIEKWKDSRSIQQNSLMWKWLSIMGNDMGYTKEEVYAHMINKFAPIYTMRNIETGKPEQKRMTTSMMDVRQMHEFMNQIDRFAAEFDIRLPQPDDELIQSLMESFDAEMD